MARGRKPSVRYWPTRGGYCVVLNGTQHMLAKGAEDGPTGPVYLEALDAFRKLVGMSLGKGTDTYLVSSCLNQYRQHLSRIRTSQAPSIFDSLAQGFCAEFGGKRAGDLLAGEVQEWLEKQDNWNPTSKNHAGQLILGALKWATKKGFIKTDPLAGRLDLPSPVRRGREARMSKELCDVLVGEAYKVRGGKRQFGDFLTVLRETGARPVELRKAEAWNVTNGRIVYRWNTTKGYLHKTAKKTQRDRVLFLNDRCTALVAALASSNPSGPIFRTPRNKPWGTTGIHNKWVWLCSRPAVLEACGKEGVGTVVKWSDNEKMEVADLVLYNFRHTFISDYLDKTGDIWTAARLCGTSVKTIEQRYGHPDDSVIHAKLRAFFDEG